MSSLAPDFDLLWKIPIPLRDGVELIATITKPKTDQPLPVIFTLTPYTTDLWWDLSAFWPGRGFIYAVVNGRGRGGSGGKFAAFFQELEDGPQVCEWLAAQPWCDGQVAMLGGSYDGTNQWLTLKSCPPHLRTIVPMTVGHFDDFPYRGGITKPDRLSWDAHTSGVDAAFSMSVDQSFWMQKYCQLYFEHIPFAGFASHVGIPAHFFKVIAENPPHSPIWNRLRLEPQDYQRFEIPILSIAGYFDPIVRSTFYFYQEFMESATPSAKENFFLVAGPWDHATASGWGEQKLEMNGMRLGQAAQVNINDLMSDWYNWVMKGGQKPEFLKDHFAYYVIGKDEWRFAKSIADIPVAPARYYLASDNCQANSIFHSGGLQSEPPRTCQPDHYIYDPLDTRPGEMELLSHESKAGPTDQRMVLNTFGNGVFYHTQQFDRETIFTGFIKLSVWIEMDVPDTDFEAVLFEILADGTQLQLSNCLLRARYREGYQTEKLVIPGEIECFEFKGFNFMSRQIARGSYLRLFLHSPNSITLQKNYNSGKVISYESAKDARTAHIKTYHDADHPSYLELPIESQDANNQ